MKNQAAILALVLILGCAAQTAQTPAAAPAPAKPITFKNLQVLPKDITREELLPIMRSFAMGLGVRCNHCHVVTATEPKEQFDFPADTKENKRAAREMLRVANALNKDMIPRVLVAAGETPHEELFVTCWTCHRGKPKPEKMPPPPPPATPPPSS